MAWLLFMDESGHSHKELSYEVRGGYALADTQLWPFVQDVLRLELSCFGARLADYKSEVKGMKLLSKETESTRTRVSASFACRTYTSPEHEKGDNAFESPSLQKSKGYSQPSLHAQ